MDQLESGSIFEKRFEILGFLGGGGMGAVYKAKQQDANRIVALKLLHPSLVETDEFRKRFLRECKLLSQLASEHIITFYHAAVSADGFPYAVFEYLDGQTLRHVLNAKNRLSVTESLSVLIQVSSAMQSAHALNVIHRDLKPENIMVSELTESWWIKVFDFGLSKDSITEERESQRLTLTGDVVGTAAYMSPEQCKGRRADARSDIYALGCIAYECLSGKQLFDEATPMASLQKHLNEDPTDAVNDLCAYCPPALSGLIMDMLQKSPSERPRSMVAVRDSLLMAESQLQQGISSSKIKDKRRSNKSIGLVVCITLLVFAALSSFLFISMQNEQKLQKSKLEESQKRSNQAAIEKRNFTVGAALVDSAGQALEAQNYADAIKYARKCASLKNNTCEYVPIRLRSLLLLTQSSNFSQLADPDPPLLRMGELLKSAKSNECLSESDKSFWTLSYLLLAANVHQGKGRHAEAIACTTEFERLHNLVPEDQKQPLKFLLTLISKGHSYRNSGQYQKAYETDQRALRYAKELKSEGADHIHSIYPSLIFDTGIINETPQKVAKLQEEYAQEFEQSFSSQNSEGMMRCILGAQDNVLGQPKYESTAAPIILSAWKAAEMFPEISTHLRMRALQRLLQLRVRQATNGKVNSKILREIASSYLLILKQAKSPSLGPSYYTSRKELAQELETRLVNDGQTNLAVKVRQAFNDFHLDD